MLHLRAAASAACSLSCGSNLEAIRQILQGQYY